MLRNHKAMFGVFCALFIRDISLCSQEAPIYNQSAMFACENSWDLTSNVDYLYWSWQQSFLPVGKMLTTDRSGSAGLINGTEEIVFQDPGYASGFQVGLGCNFHGMDDWRFKADFTWYENSSRYNRVPKSGQYLIVATELVETLYRLNAGALLSNSLQTSAKMQFDALDTTLQRIFYQGKKLTVQYKMGLKTLWIDQNMSAASSDLSFIGIDTPFSVPLVGSFTSSSSLKSWALGPFFGTEAHFLLPLGFSIEGDLALSLVYTKYTTLRFSVSGQILESRSADFLLCQSHSYELVNPILETCLGIGWGSYLCHDNLYLKFFAGYDFQIYWNRNVLISFLGQGASAGNMSLQGLNVQAQIQF